MRCFAVLFTVLFFVVLSIASPLDLGRGKSDGWNNWADVGGFVAGVVLYHNVTIKNLYISRWSL